MEIVEACTAETGLSMGCLLYTSRTVFFMPNLIGGIVLGYIWQLLLNGILAKFGVTLSFDAKYGFWGLVILMNWQLIGYMMIIYIAGLQNVSPDLIEAAKIDGATKTQTCLLYTSRCV